MDIRGRRVLVMGLGRSGQAAARLAVERGARVVGIDLRTGLEPIDGVTLELGPHRDERFDEADLIIVSPGIPPSQRQLAHARQSGTPVVGELGFAAAFVDAPMIAVTGTNGKSTVTWFTHQLLQAAGRRAFVGGNLGNPLSNAALEPHPYDVLVVEVSSYQLELPGTLKPNVGVILNLTPDHLTRHGTMQAYAQAKARLFERMGPDQIAILPAGDARLAEAAAQTQASRAWLGGTPGVRRDGAAAELCLPGRSPVALSLEAVLVPGEHNRDNAATSAFLALSVGVDPTSLEEGLSALQALPHRMEVVADVGDVQWINDSKATNIAAAEAGIGGLARRAVVLLGGQGKPGSDGTLGFAALVSSLARHRAVVAFGASGPEIGRELAEAGMVSQVIPDLAGAVRLARTMVRPGEAVLLSPGCASFDAFDDFEHRGRVFAELAQEDA